MTKFTATIKQIYTPLAEIDKALGLQLKREKVYAFELENRLQEWGRWLAKCLDNGMGYPNRSATDKALEGSHGSAPVYPPDNPYAEAVNIAFLDLRNKHHLWADVLESEYVHTLTQIEKESGLTRSKKMEDRAKRLQITFGNYKVMLRAAKSFIEGRISR
jgi:hypothetical protein